MTIRPAIASVASAVLSGLVLVPSALAADGESTPLHLGDADTSTTRAPDVGGAGSGIVRTIIGLAVVIAVIYGLAWVLKQVKGAREERASGNGLTPLATLPLGGNRSLQLVRVGNEVVLVGIGDGAVTPLRTYAEPEARALGLLADGPAPVDTRAAALSALGQDPVPEGPSTPGGRVLAELRRRTVIR